MMVSNALLKLAEMGRQAPRFHLTRHRPLIFGAALLDPARTTRARGSARPYRPSPSPALLSARNPPSKQQKPLAPANTVRYSATPLPPPPPSSSFTHAPVGDFTTIGPHAIATIKTVVPVTFGSSRHTRRHNDPGPGPGQYSPPLPPPMPLTMTPLLRIEHMAVAQVPFAVIHRAAGCQQEEYAQLQVRQLEGFISLRMEAACC